MNMWQFMSDSPVLTFFLAMILTGGVVKVIAALRGLPEHCESCRCTDTDEDLETKS
jgi:hypothetical protein